MLDRTGALIGITESSLNDKFVLKQAGFVPQNVNFAVRKAVIQTFLSAQSVTPVFAENKAERSVEDIADTARKSVFLIECLK